MTPDDVKKIVQDCLKDALTPVLTEFRANNAPPSEDEMKAAGCVEGDNEEQKKEKVKMYRAKLDQPATVREVMQIFRFSGGNAAKASIADDDKGGGKVTPFEKRLKAYEDAGMTHGRALFRAKADDKDGYNTYVQKQNQGGTSDKEKK